MESGLNPNASSFIPSNGKRGPGRPRKSTDSFDMNQIFASLSAEQLRQMADQKKQQENNEQLVGYYSNPVNVGQAHMAMTNELSSVKAEIIALKASVSELTAENAKFKKYIESNISRINTVTTILMAVFTMIKLFMASAILGIANASNDRTFQNQARNQMMKQSGFEGSMFNPTQVITALQSKFNHLNSVITPIKETKQLE